MALNDDRAVAGATPRQFPFGFLPRPAERRLQEEEMARRNPHLAKAQLEEKREGQRLAILARTAALAVTAVLLAFVNPRWEVLYYEAILLVFILIGWAQLRFARVGQSGPELALIFADLVLLTITLTVPNPFSNEPWPTAVQYRFDGFGYFYIFLAGSTLAYSWRTVQTIGAWTAIVWMGGLAAVWFLGTRDAAMGQRVQEALAGNPRLFELVDPNSPLVSSRVQEVVIFLIVALILALKARRSADLLMRQASLAAERANLSRYFPPSMVEELAMRSEPMGRERSQEVAVLFADIVGFTRMAETMQPAQVIELLRDFHGALEEAVFSHGGTLDKYLGDGVMASFGTPVAGPGDAANALAAAFAMQEGVARLNASRRAGGQEEIRLSVGVHYGPVILGDIGSERRMEFAMLGDTVNVASRLESFTRSIGASLVASDSVLRAVADESERLRLCSLLQRRPAQSIRGRAEPVDVWTA